MKVVGIGQDGTAAFDGVLDHGVDPGVLAHDRGFLALRPIDVVREEDGELVLRLVVRPLSGEHSPAVRPRGRDAGLVLTGGGPPIVRQRVAGYAVVLSAR